MTVPSLRRLFLSYGRKDTADLANRLKADLEKHGFSVWVDSHEVRGGTEWEKTIRDSLRGTQLVVAVLSPHAVRVAGPGMSDERDGVCLDEISYARFEHPRKIVPVMAIRCEPPFCIFRLDYVDLTGWREDEGKYRVGLNRLLQSIDAVFEGKVTYRSWHHQLRPLDFELYLDEKRRDFMGRNWLFEQIDSWRIRGRERMLLIVGAPGSGKSAIVAQLVHRNPGSQVIAYHCCQAARQETLIPGRFVQSVAAMIASQVEDYARILEDPEIQEYLSDVSCSGDPGIAFDHAILQPLHRLSPPEGVKYLLIDALDESLLIAGTHHGDGNLVDLLAVRREQLPCWLRVLATSRPEKGVVRKLSGLRAVILDAEGDRCRTDIETFLAIRLNTPTLREKLSTCGLNEVEVRRQLRTAAGSNFLYAKQALQDIEREIYSFEQLGQLPRGLEGMYFDYFNRIFARKDDYSDARKVLEAMVAAFEPLNLTQLAEATAIDAEYGLPDVLARLASFLREQDGCYEFYHRSIKDWLIASDCPYRASELYGHSRLAEMGWSEYQQGPNHFSEYSRKYLVSHLCRVARWKDVVTLLTDLAYLQARCDVGQVFDMLRDFSIALDAWPARQSQQQCVQILDEAIRQDANFIARHPGTLFQCVWNAGWWYANPEAECHYEPLVDSTGNEIGDMGLRQLLERWRSEKAKIAPRFWWLRRLRPPPVALGSGQQAVLAGHLGDIDCLASSPSDAVIASASSDGTIRLWETQTGREIRCLEGHAGGVLSVAFAPDGGSIISGGQDCTVRVWDSGNGKLRLCLREHTGWVVSVAVSPRSDEFVSGSDDGSLRIWRMCDGGQRHLQQRETQIRCVSWSPDGGLIADGTADGAIHICDASSGSEVTFLAGDGEDIDCMAFSPLGDLLAIGKADNTVRLWHTSARRWSHILSTGHERIISVVFEEDGGSLLGCTAQGNGFRWGVQAGQCRQHFRILHKGTIKHLALSADSRWLFSGAIDGFVRIWKRAKLDQNGLLQSRPLRGHNARIRTIAYSADGRWLASGADDRTARLWDSATCTERFCLSGHEGPIRRVAFSPDSRWIASASEDRTVRIWEVVTGRLQHVLADHAGKVVDVAFSPDGQLVISEGWHKRYVWEAKTGKCVQVLPRSAEVLVFSPPCHSPDWNIVKTEHSLVLQTASGNAAVAWFPAGVDLFVGHPQRAEWAGAADWYLSVVRLERG